MREIQFRGLQKLSNLVIKMGLKPKMVYGTGIFKDSVNTWLYKKDNISCMAEEKAWDHEIIDPETVGQFTGLLDRNGVKIFEGDILKDGKGENGIIVYHENTASFYANVNNEYYNLNENKLDRPTTLSYTEVIGNIHEEEK